MSVRKIEASYQLAEARGHIPAGTAARATLATILEAGIVAFAKGFYGRDEYSKISESQANKDAKENTGILQESLLSDVTQVRRALKEAHTTTDFPAILANLRKRVVRQSYNPVESNFWEMAVRREVSDFKPIKGIRIGTFDRLLKRPEGTDVKESTFGTTEDAYVIANYELAFAYTWEMWKNDDLGIFTLGLQNLGVAARRTRALVVFEAIKDGLARTTLGTVGGPDVDRLTLLVQALAEQTENGKPLPRSLSDIAFPAKWRTLAATTLNSQNLIGATAKMPEANPVFQTATPHEEVMMAEVLGADWLGWDARNPWLEVSVLDDFVGGPLTYAELPDSADHIEQGSFSNHKMRVKVGDAVGSKVTDAKSVVRVKGD